MPLPGPTITDFTPTANYPIASSQFYPNLTVSTLTAGQNNTLTVAQMLGYFIVFDTSSGARNLTTPTAAALVAAIMGCQVGTSFRFLVKNTSAGAGTITLVAGTGITLTPASPTVAFGNAREFLAVVTNATYGSEAITIFTVGAASATAA